MPAFWMAAALPVLPAPPEPPSPTAELIAGISG